MWDMKQHIEVDFFNNDYAFEWFDFSYQDDELILFPDMEISDLENLLFKTYDENGDEEFFLED